VQGRFWIQVLTFSFAPGGANYQQTFGGFLSFRLSKMEGATFKRSAEMVTPRVRPIVPRVETGGAFTAFSTVES